MNTSILRKIRRAYELGPRWAGTMLSLRARRALRLLPHIPPTLYVELTNACNLNCAMCDRKSMTREESMMDMDLFTRIIDNAAEIRVPVVKLNRFGESLLHPRLTDMIRYSKERGIPWVYFTSNATLLNEQKATDILTSGLDSITFSVDGATAGTYEGIRKGAAYNKTVQNIRRFCELRETLRAGKPRTVVNTLLMRETWNEMADFFRTWTPIVDRINVMPVGRYGNVEDFSPIDRTRLKHEKRACHHPFDRLMIFWNGDVTICCGDINGELKIGNVLDDRIEKLWKNETIRKYRRMHVAKQFDEIPICDQCDGTNLTLFNEMAKARQNIYRRARASVQ